MISDDIRLSIIQIALRWAWDPIGVRSIQEAADEYDMYAPGLLELLEADAPVGEIANYLAGVCHDRIELSSNPERDRDVASMLKQMVAVIR